MVLLIGCVHPLCCLTVQLNEVMEKETYKTAIELLQRYDPNHPSLQQHKPRADLAAQQTPANHGNSRRTEVRRRVIHHTPHPSQLQHHHTMTTPAPAPAPTPPHIKETSLR